MNDTTKPYQGENHEGEQRSAPYPVSRLASPIELVDLAREIERADEVVNLRVGAKLQVIAHQIRALQEQARGILADAQRDQLLHRAQCNFKRIPGKTYHLYRKSDGRTYFSMVAPGEWNGQAPHEFVGSYRLEADMSWVPADSTRDGDRVHALVAHLLAGEDR